MNTDTHARSLAAATTDSERPGGQPTVCAGLSPPGLVRRTNEDSLLLLPAVVQMVILLVNGNVGTGVAVAGVAMHRMEARRSRA